MSTPTIYAFCNTPPNMNDWYSCLAMAEDGHVLAEHICSHPHWGPLDLGVRGDTPIGNQKRAKYAEHYPNGYEIVWLTDPSDPRLVAAYALNQQIAAQQSATP